jgi:hypothetical protein
MSAIHRSEGRRVILQWPDEQRHVATCATTEAARQAALWLDRARYLNDQKRQYTAAARLIARVEALPGFGWTA